MAVPGIDHLDGFGAALMCLTSGRIATGGDVVEALGMFDRVSSDDPAYEAVRRGRASTLGVFTGLDWRHAVDVYAGPPPTDTIARLQHYFFGGTTLAVAPPDVVGLDPDRALDKAIERIDEGLGWAAEIGALNYEASLHQVMGNILVRSGRYAEGLEAARVAAELAEQLGMTVTRDLTQYHHIVATLMGEETGVDAFALVVETLESTLQTGFRGTAAYLVKIAARYLVNAGHAETAALCMLQPDIGFPDILPDYGISSIPEGAWESARGQAPTLDILDVAERALKELRALGDPTLPSSS